MTRDTDQTDTDLDFFLEAVRKDRFDAEPALLARVLADAEAAQAEFSTLEDADAKVTRRGGLAAFLTALGGWPAAAGLSAATVAGVWIGVAPPTGLALTAQDLLAGDDYSLTEMMPDASFGLTGEAL